MISACLIVKDEEKCIGRCLNSLKGLADEIIIVDTGSSDRTKEISSGFTDKVFDFTWADDFSKARNFSISHATGDWILVIDADEVIDSENRTKIKEATRMGADAILVIQREYQRKADNPGRIPVDKKTELTLDYEWFTKTPIIRIFKRRKEIYYEGAVHESVGRSVEKAGLKVLIREDIFIHHYKDEQGDGKVLEKELNYLKILLDSVKREPKDGRSHYKISNIYSSYLKDDNKSLEHAKLALDQGYNEKFCLMAIGNSQFNLGMLKAAEKTFIDALSKGYDEPGIYYVLSKIYLRKKEPDKAKIVLKKFVTFMTPFRQDALDILKRLG